MERFWLWAQPLVEIFKQISCVPGVVYEFEGPEIVGLKPALGLFFQTLVSDLLESWGQGGIHGQTAGKDQHGGYRQWLLDLGNLLLIGSADLQKIDSLKKARYVLFHQEYVRGMTINELQALGHALPVGMRLAVEVDTNPGDWERALYAVRKLKEGYDGELATLLVPDIYHLYLQCGGSVNDKTTNFEALGRAIGLVEDVLINSQDLGDLWLHMAVGPIDGFNLAEICNEKIEFMKRMAKIAMHPRTKGMTIEYQLGHLAGRFPRHKALYKHGELLRKNALMMLGSGFWG